MFQARTHADGKHDQASQTVTLNLKAGDVVRVEGAWKISMVQGNAYPYNTFSGRLITPAK